MAPEDSLRGSSGTLVDHLSLATPSRAAESYPDIDARAGERLSRSARLPFSLAFFAIGITTLVLFAAILKINSGIFIYTLDDPYIHLALSDQIRHGNYGLYPGTHAAPSSSIIFPFLLAVASGTPLHPWLPLLLNLGALFFTAEVIRRLLLHLKLGADGFAFATQAAFLFLMALCFNMIGVVFTGLEHSLHIATVAAIVYGLALFLDSDNDIEKDSQNATREVPTWLPAAIVFCPLVRYEGFALSVGALLVLALRQHWRTALATFAVISLLMGGFSAFLVNLGLPPLPSSILTKSAVAASGVDGSHLQVLRGLSRNINFVFSHPVGVSLLLVTVVALCICARDLLIQPRGWTSRSLMSVVLLVSIGGHTVAGGFGWLDRYEDYVMVSTALMCIYLGQSAIRSALAPIRKDRVIVVVGAAAALLIIGARYLHTTVEDPIASNNIYEQQLQMHRFVDGFYRGSIAINDLGLSSYHNPYPVLDLGGLGSEQARLMVAAHADSEDFAKLVAAHGVHLVIVYQEWFPGQIPETWQRVGTMSLSREHVSAAQNEVQFYVTDDATATKVREELAAFKNTLPTRIKLTVY